MLVALLHVAIDESAFSMSCVMDNHQVLLCEASDLAGTSLGSFNVIFLRTEGLELWPHEHQVPRAQPLSPKFLATQTPQNASQFIIILLNKSLSRSSDDAWHFVASWCADTFGWKWGFGSTFQGAQTPQAFSGRVY